jgi:hypothetical protein
MRAREPAAPWRPSQERQAQFEAKWEQNLRAQAMSDIAERLHTIRTHLRTGALGQREVWEEWLTEAAAEVERLMADKKHLLSKLDALSTVLELRWQDVERFEAENERLMAAIWRIDAINDNMACYNPDINAVCDPILRPELGCDQPGVAGEGEPEGQREHRDLKANR